MNREDHLAHQYDLRNRIGSYFPTRPQDGWRCFRDDITNPEWFYYDENRSRWLSERAVDFYFSHVSGTAGYLDAHDGIQSSATFGYYLEHDYTLTEFNLLRDATGTTPTYRLTASGTDIAQSIFLTTGATTAINQSLQIDRNQGEIIGCRILSGTSTGNVMAQVRFRRRV